MQVQWKKQSGPLLVSKPLGLTIPQTILLRADQIIE